MMRVMMRVSDESEGVDRARWDELWNE